MLSKEELLAFHKVMKDKMFRYRTTSLFWETRTSIRPTEIDYDPIFTLKDRDIIKDGVTLYSLKNIYMAYDHIPEYEYEFALDVFGSWDQWQRLANDSTIRTHIKDWRLEVEVKLKAEAIRAMLAASREGDAKGVAAAKYIADKGYSVKRGRPSKEEVERERKISAGVSKDLEHDMERLGLSVVNGGK